MGRFNRICGLVFLVLAVWAGTAVSQQAAGNLEGQTSTAYRFFIGIFGVLGLGILVCMIPLVRRRERLGGILLSPGATLREVAVQPDWVGPFFLALISALLFALAGISAVVKKGALQAGSPGQQAAMIFVPVMILVFAMIAAFGVWFVRTGCLYVLARISGEKTRFYTLLCTVGYALLPLAISSMVIFGIYGFGRMSIPDMITPTSMASLFPDLVRGNRPGAMVGPGGFTASPLGAFLKEIELFAFWSVALTVVGMQRVYGFSMRKAALINAVYWILSLGAVVGFAALMRS